MDAPADAPQPRRFRRDWRRWGPRAVFECVLIVFSVILALGLTNWAEDRRTASEVAEARAFFVAEMRANRDLLRDDAFLPHHHRLREIFGEAARLSEVTRSDAMQAYGAVFETGLHMPPLRDAVWRSVGSGPLLGEMDLEDVFLLSDVYAAQARVMRAHEGFVASMPSILGDVERGDGLRAAVMSGQLNLGDVVASEEGLLRLYDQALARLDPDGAAATPRPRDAGRAGG